MVLVGIVVGCESSQKHPPLTEGDAETLAIRLANSKAETLFHYQPFQKSQPAQFVGGCWIWSGRAGAGLLDFQARVELAADGSTNRVDLELLDNALRPRVR